MPDFLQRKHGLALMKIGIPIMVIYVLADVGSNIKQQRSIRIVCREAAVDEDNVAIRWLLCEERRGRHSVLVYDLSLRDRDTLPDLQERREQNR